MNIFNTREIEKRSLVTKIGRMKIENYIVHVGRDGCSVLESNDI